MDKKCATFSLYFSLAFVVLYLLASLAEEWSAPKTGRVPIIDVRSPPAVASRTGSRIISPKQERAIPFPEHDTLPHHEYLKGPEELKSATWAADLHEYLQALNRNVSPHVNLVFGDYKHRILVANWVVAATLKAKPPLNNVLVLSLDELLCNFLASSMSYMTHPPNATCIAAPVDTMLSSKGDNKWRASMMTRPIILRMINYWGYDVAAYDSDAVVLKNPQEIFQQYSQDILSSASYWPDYQAQPWGFTLCAGAVLYRASPATEMFWRFLSNVTGRADQVSLNEALKNLNISWNKTTRLSQICSVDGWQGEAHGGLRVFVFPQRLFCRRDCCRRASRTGVYVVHPGGEHGDIGDKIYSLEYTNAWFISVPIG